ncbi:MAG TPA: cbb3-type cytochrome c oxidase N-terminal domain-containing protein [Phycisphaerales bacterium]|nr:cbb3-type cytochrome c oxidase N-terminal domain-containing protein [Phycisphaerales bacterium]HMP37689.1 cbb3-type cytochrome c oxidase N-terminal domain-containing protein [Phycisphaerales bacterium]
MSSPASDRSAPTGAASATAAELLDHEYDGIRELDNPVPGWWHLLFWATIAFSVVYYAFFQFSPVAWTVQDSWEAAQAEAYQRIFGELGELKPDEATIRSLMNDDRMMAVARGMFVGNCAACHGRDGGGINGVNLTDDHYRNVASLGDLLTVINRGAAAGAMPAWENRLSQNERILLAAYTARLRGTYAPGRGPEGSVIPPWPAR